MRRFALIKRKKGKFGMQSSGRRACLEYKKVLRDALGCIECS